MKRIIVSMIFVLLCCSTKAQHITLSGRVADMQSAEPLPFANAVLCGTADTLIVKGCTTDIDGSFAIKDVEAGSYLMRITMVGYQTWEQVLTIAGSMDLATIALAPGTRLSEVEVKAARPLFAMDGEKIIYTTSDDPSIQSGTAVDALQNAPGIEVDAEGNIKLRGTLAVGMWINGRECRMNAEALKQYLKTLPAKNIKKIEVVTNPSARYGGGPMVNIVTQDRTSDNHLLCLGANASSRPEAVPSISYIYNSERWEVDLYANLAYLHESETRNGREALLDSDKDTARVDQYTLTKEERSLNALFSVDLACHLDSQTAVYAWGGLMPSWTGWESSTGMRRQEYIYCPGDYSFEGHEGKKMRGGPGGGIMDGIWLERVFDKNTGHTLMGGYYGSLWMSDSLVEGERRFATASPAQLKYRQSNRTREWAHCMEVNYMKPFGEMDTLSGALPFELEGGGEISITKSLAIVSTDTAVRGGYSNCGWMSSTADASTTTAALYASLLHRWDRLTIKGGMRCEALHGRMAYPDARAYNFDHGGATFVPSVHLTYTTSERSAFALGYTFRTGTPNPSDLSGRKYYTLDGYSTGNPILKKSATHNLELKWDTYKDGLGSVGIVGYFSSLSNKMERMTDVAFEGDIFHRIVTFTQPVNIGGSWNGGVEVHAVYRPNAFVNVRLNGNIYYDHLELEYRNEPYRKGMLCYSMRLNAWAKLWGTVQLFGNLYYTSSTQSLFTTNSERKGIDVGLNADWFDKRLSLNLGINDLFDWNKWGAASSNPFLDGDMDLVQNSRYVSFGATLRLGRMDLKDSSRRVGRQRTDEGVGGRQEAP